MESPNPPTHSLVLHFLGETIVWNATLNPYEDPARFVKHQLATQHGLPESHVHTWPHPTHEQLVTENVTTSHLFCFLQPRASIDLSWISTNNIRAHEFQVALQDYTWSIQYLKPDMYGSTEWTRFMSNPIDLSAVRSGDPDGVPKTAHFHITYHEVDMSYLTFPLVEIGLFERAHLLATTSEYHHLSIHSLDRNVFTYRVSDFVSSSTVPNAVSMSTSIEWSTQPTSIGVDHVRLESRTPRTQIAEFVMGDTHLRTHTYVLFVSVRTFRQVKGRVELMFS